MRLRDSILILTGWVGLCLLSGSLVTLAAHVLPA